MHNFPHQLAIQSCVLCSFVRCGTSNQIEKEKEKKTSWETSEDVNIFKEKPIMQLKEHMANAKQKSNNLPRTILVKLLNYKDKEIIM